MFHDNKYSKTYFKIVNHPRVASRRKGDSYYERHHIIPRCLGGNNSVDNLVLLTAREHFLCHYLLTKMSPEPKLVYALHRMTHSGDMHQRYRSRLYATARERFGEAIADLHRKRFSRDPGLRQKVSDQFRGKKRSPEAVAKMAAAQKGKTVSAETRAAISKANKGRPNEALRGKPKTVEHKQALADAKRGKPGNNRQWWEITTPEGVAIVTQDRKTFCADHQLNFDSVKAMTQKGPLYKGYSFVKLPAPPSLPCE